VRCFDDIEEVLDIYKKTGALLSGHFLLSSGLHSDRYLQSALVLQQPDIATKLCAALAKPFRDQRIEAVIAPALGGVFVSHETARALGVRALFAERVNGVLTLRRGSRSNRVGGCWSWRMSSRPGNPPRKRSRW
jgi:orotate phosphoribosyltransferase